MNAFSEPSIRIALSASAFGTPVDNETMVMDIEQGRYLVLNDIGSAIWEILAGSSEGVTVGEVIGRLEQRYEADAGTIAADVSAFLSKLSERRLIETA
jgi:hypothetical protein